jgi:hypothetical protein
MRSLPVLFLLPLLAFQAHAQTTPPAPVAPTAGAVDMSNPASDAAGAKTAKHHRMTWKERFAQANVTHDGHLTLEQAKSGHDALVARHFTEIDADKKGYVTEDDIANWHKMQRATRHSRATRTEEGLQPRHAFQQGTDTPRLMKTSTSTRLLPMAQPDAQPADQQATAK